MTFLPIVDRELRVAVRRGITYWIRPITASLAILVSLVFIGISLITRNPSQLGEILFTILSVYAFALCLLAGVFVTADAISSELRDGTLGFLFLTDLKGYDIVLGKFTGRSLNAFYALVSVFPVLALPLLIGGVTGTEFWRMTLALINTLFFSLVSGMFISVFSRDPQKAMGGTLALLAVTVAGLPLLAALGSTFTKSEPAGWIVLCSPFSPFKEALTTGALRGGPTQFWPALLGSHACGWILLAWASVALPYRWRAVSLPKSRVASRFGRRPRSSTSPPPFTRRDRRLLDKNPILWLAQGSAPRWHVAVWLLAVAIAGIWLAAPVFSRVAGPPLFFMHAYISWPFTLVLRILMAIQACRFFVEARRSGILELLLTTPLTNAEFLRGQWLLLRKNFLWPVILILASQLVSFIAVCIFTWFKTHQVAEFFSQVIFSGMFMIGVPRLVTNLLAIACLGTYLSLTLKKPNYAAGLTLLLVVLLPTLVPCFFVNSILSLALDVVFILWPWTLLRRNLRDLAIRHYAPQPVRAAPLIATPPPVRAA